ncbi:MAG: hypothetical protein B7Y80_14665 [Hyphomicrobium sp. 32-62-53]|nr:MAG: hypothetical protein B7Y80_14665 [Hyphomicrobium sp. 32-62-53]
MLIASTTSMALAGGGGLSEKVMKDNPGVSGQGGTTQPTVKPETGGLAEKAMKDAPGVTGGGTTANPTAKPETGGLAEKAMQDHPGIDKK